MRELFFEEIEVGATGASGEYAVTEQEILEFGRRFDPRPIHIDAAAAASSAFGDLVASGCHVFCIRSWLASRLDPRPALVAGLGLESMDLPAPVRAGDRLSLRVEYLDKRLSRSRPDRGVVRMRNTVVNQRGEAVMRLVAKLLVPCRGDGLRTAS
jgi:acyl dehydratase